MSAEAHECEMCGESYTSLRAAWMCEERDIAEQRDSTRPVRHAPRPASYWDED